MLLVACIRRRKYDGEDVIVVLGKVNLHAVFDEVL